MAFFFSLTRQAMRPALIVAASWANMVVLPPSVVYADAKVSLLPKENFIQELAKVPVEKRSDKVFRQVGKGFGTAANVVLGPPAETLKIYLLLRHSGLSVATPSFSQLYYGSFARGLGKWGLLAAKDTVVSIGAQVKGEKLSPYESAAASLVATQVFMPFTMLFRVAFQARQNEMAYPQFMRGLKTPEGRHAVLSHAKIYYASETVRAGVYLILPDWIQQSLPSPVKSKAPMAQAILNAFLGYFGMTLVESAVVAKAEAKSTLDSQRKLTRYEGTMRPVPWGQAYRAMLPKNLLCNTIMLAYLLGANFAELYKAGLLLTDSDAVPPESEVFLPTAPGQF